MKEYLASNLRYLREKNGLTCEKLAVMVGVHTSTINYFEHGKRKASQETAQRIADLFQVSADALCNEDLEASAELDMLYNSKTLMGYIIEYSEKNVFDPAEKPKKAVCTQKKLVWILERQLSYIVWSANWCNISHYVRNNPEVPYFQK